MPTLSYPGTPGTTLYAGLPTPSGGTLLTTRTLLNETMTEQAAGFCPDMFAWCFKPGQVPAGDWPLLETEDEVPCAYTPMGKSTWPDGSLKIMAFLVRFPQAIPALGSKPLHIKNGGTNPGAGAMTLSDLTAADIKLEITGITNLTGTWTSSLNDGITQNDDVVLVGSGPAGSVWEIGAHYRDGSSVAHGQLYGEHYVIAMQDAAGDLMGIRRACRSGQMFADVASPTVTYREFSAVVKSGATTIRTLQGAQAGETATSTITCSHYSTFMDHGSDAKYDFVQGGGSASADHVTRWTFSADDLISSRMLPPYDTATSPTANTSVDYLPYGRGSMRRAMGDTGGRQDIAVLPGWCARHLLSQEAVDERVIRVNAALTSGWRVAAQRESTKMPVPMTDISASYTGLGDCQPTWMFFPGLLVGFSNPAAISTLWSGEYDSHHRPTNCFYAYLMTGEPQYLRMLNEQAANFLAILPPGDATTWSTTSPITTSPRSGYFHSRDPFVGAVKFKGAGAFFRSDLMRYAAWMLRDIAQAAAVYPDTCPRGTEMRKYLREVLDSNYDAINHYHDELPASWSEDGLFGLDPRTNLGIEAPWCIGFFSHSIAHQYSILGNNAKALQVMQHTSRYFQRLEEQTDLDFTAAYATQMYVFKEDDTRIEQIEDALFKLSVTLTFNTGTQVFGFSGGTVNNDDFNVTNGDFWMFNGGTKPFTAAADRRRLYAVESTGRTFKLSLTPGGSPETITTTGTVSSPWCRLASFSPNLVWDGLIDNDVYLTNVRGALRHLEAVGMTNVNAARLLSDGHLASTILNPNNFPKDAFAAAYPE